VKPGACLTTGGMPVSIDRFVAIDVTPVSLRPLITVGNPGAWSCFVVVLVSVLCLQSKPFR
jgi:hypothetical protein